MKAYIETLDMPNYDTMKNIKLYRTISGPEYNEREAYKFFEDIYEYGWSDYQKLLYRQEMKMPGFIEEVKKIEKELLEYIQYKWNFSDNLIYIDNFEIKKYSQNGGNMKYYFTIFSKIKDPKIYNYKSKFYIKFKWENGNSYGAPDTYKIKNGELKTDKKNLNDITVQLDIPANLFWEKINDGYEIKQPHSYKMNIKLYVENKQTGEYDLVDVLEKEYYYGP